MTFEEARAAFPVLQHTAYLNAGTTGPLARETAEAVAAQHRADAEGGRSGPAYWTRMLELRSSVRTAIAALLGAEDSQVALTYSTTGGCNAVVAGLELRPEDEVVTTDEEHFGLLGPLHVSGARVRVAQTRGLAAEQALEALLAEVGRKTRLLALSHVSWATGNLLPVAELKERTGLPIMIDGAQSAGAIPMDMSPYDFYTVSTQKWPCGPDATGALYVADPDALPVAFPTYLSQQQHDLDGTFTPREGAARFDSGAIPVASLAGLEAALAVPPAWRYERAFQMAEQFRTRLAERYEVVTQPRQSTLVSFVPAGEPPALGARLAEQGVIVRDIPRTPWLRVSVGYWSNEDDLERLLAGLA